MIDFNAPGSSALNAALRSELWARRRPQTTQGTIAGNLYPATVGYDYFTYYGLWTSAVPADNRVTIPMNLTVSGVDHPFDWSIVDGALPPGLALDDSDPDDDLCAVSGVATAAGDYTFTVRVTRTAPGSLNHRQATGVFSIFVGDPRFYDNLPFFSAMETLGFPWGSDHGDGAADGILLWVPANFGNFGVGSEVNAMSLRGATYAPVGFPGSPKQWSIRLIPDDTLCEFWLALEAGGNAIRWTKAGPVLPGDYDDPLNGLGSIWAPSPSPITIT